MATYTFPVLLLLFSFLLAGFNLLFPQVVSLLVIILGVIVAWAIIKLNEG